MVLLGLVEMVVELPEPLHTSPPLCQDKVTESLDKWVLQHILQVQTQWALKTPWPSAGRPVSVAAEISYTGRGRGWEGFWGACKLRIRIGTRMWYTTSWDTI